MLWLLAIVRKFIPLPLYDSLGTNDFSLKLNATLGYVINITEPHYLFLCHSNTNSFIEITLRNVSYKITKNSNISGISFGNFTGQLLAYSNNYSYVNFSLIRIPDLCNNITVSTYSNFDFYHNISSRNHSIATKYVPVNCYILSPSGLAHRFVSYNSKNNLGSYLDRYHYYENQLHFNIDQYFNSSCIIQTKGNNNTLLIQQREIEPPEHREIEFNFTDIYSSYIIYFSSEPKPPIPTESQMTTDTIYSYMTFSQDTFPVSNIDMIQIITILLFILAGTFVMLIIGIVLYVHYYKMKKINETIMNEMLMESTETNNIEINT